MLVEFPVIYTTVLRQLFAVLNLSLLVGVLAATKLIDLEWLSGLQHHMRDFYPMLAVLFCLLIVAVCKT